MHVYRQPHFYRARRPWVGTAAGGVPPVTNEHTPAIYAYAGGRSGPPGTIEMAARSG